MKLVLKVKGKSGDCYIPVLNLEKTKTICNWFKKDQEITKHDLQIVAEKINNILMNKNGIEIGDSLENIAGVLKEIIELLYTLNWEADFKIYYI